MDLVWAKVGHIGFVSCLFCGVCSYMLISLQHISICITLCCFFAMLVRHPGMVCALCTIFPVFAAYRYVVYVSFCLPTRTVPDDELVMFNAISRCACGISFLYKFFILFWLAYPLAK